MDAAIIWDEAYAEHETGAHPEGVDRIAAVVDYLRTTDLWPRLTVVKPEPATEDDVLLVHTRPHLDTVKRAAAVTPPVASALIERSGLSEIRPHETLPE